MKDRRTTILLSVVLIAVAAACSLPTASGITTSVEARMNAGGTFGSGHVIAPPPSEGTTLNADSIPSDLGTEVVPQESTGRGGTFGSGH